MGVICLSGDDFREFRPQMGGDGGWESGNVDNQVRPQAGPQLS